jgi:hypothetical protein
MMESTPNIKAVALTMASAHGFFDRNTTEEQLLGAAKQALEADGVYFSDVVALEEWLGTLTEEQRLTLVDGEEEEMSALVASSPTSVLSGMCVGQLVEDIYVSMAELRGLW